VDIFIETVKEHRFLLVLRGEGLSGNLIDTDPQEIGKKPYQPRALSSGAEKTADLIKIFIDRAYEILRDQHPANMVLMRGFSQKPDLPPMEEVLVLKAQLLQHTQCIVVLLNYLECKYWKQREK